MSLEIEADFQCLVTEGKTLETEAENVAELAAQEFTSKQLPILNALQIA